MKDMETKIIGLAEGCKILGVSRSFLYGACEQGLINIAFKIGSLWKFDQKELIRFFRSGKYQEIRQQKLQG